MNLSVNSQQLAVELRLLSKIVPSKPPVPILGHVLLARSGNDKINLYATDLEVTLKTSCAADFMGEADDPLVLPATRFLSMVEQFPDAEVSIFSSGGKTIVKCGAFTSQVQALRAADFPSVPAMEGQQAQLYLPALHQLIDRTRAAINGTNSKHILRGALLTLEGQVAAMVATDQQRLCLAMVGCDDGPALKMVLPLRSLDVLTSLAGDGNVQIAAGDRYLHFAFDDKVLSSRVIEGEFPNYTRVIPRANDKVATLPKAALAAALRRVRVAAEESKGVHFSFAENVLTLSTTSLEVGSAEEQVRVDYAGEPIKVTLDVDAVLDFLAQAANPEVTIRMKDERTAVLLQDGESYLGVLVVVRPK